MATTKEYLQDLVAQKNTLVTALMMAGAEVGESETFSTLVPKVADSIERGYEAGKQEGYDEGYLVGSEQNAEASELWYAVTNGGNRATSLFDGCSTVTTLPSLSFPEVADMSSMFRNCSALTEVELEVPNVNSMSTAFYNCKVLTKVTFKGTPPKPSDMTKAFQSCALLVDVPNIDFSEVTSLSYAFSGCGSLKTIIINAPKCTNFTHAFSYIPTDKEVTLTVSELCKSFGNAFYGGRTKTVTILGDTSAVTEWGGAFAGVITLQGDNLIFNGRMDTYSFGGSLVNFFPKSISSSIPLSKCSALSLESAKAVINALVDYSGTENEYVYSVTFSAATKLLLEEDGATAPNGRTWIDYANSKGWNI